MRKAKQMAGGLAPSRFPVDAYLTKDMVNWTIFDTFFVHGFIFPARRKVFQSDFIDI